MNKEILKIWDNLVVLNVQRKEKNNKRGYTLENLHRGYNVKIGNSILTCREDLFDFLERNQNSYIKNITLLKDGRFLGKTKKATGLDIRNTFRWLEERWGIKHIRLIKVDNMEKYVAKLTLKGVTLKDYKEFPWFIAMSYNDNSCDLITENIIEIVSENFELMENRGLESLYIDALDISKVVTLNCLFYNNTSLKTVVLRNFDISEITEMNLAFSNCTSLENINFEDWGLNSGRIKGLLEQRNINNTKLRNKLKKLLEE